MISTKNLEYQFPDSKPLIFPDIILNKGHSLLICGESGCGKTTFLHLLAGLRKPTQGKITFDNEELSSLSASKLDQFRGRTIGIVFQQSYFVQSLSVLENLLVSPHSVNKTKAKTVCKRLKIDDLLNRKPHQLSTGQQQRANIARAVMNAPKLILADEPTSALDDKNCKQVLSLLKEEAKINKAALIIVTHDNRLKSDFDNVIKLNPLKKS
jgi:putative ABC transport system ATP-binding protein